MIIATAGHVDHGKTALVRRLTGIDTDRLPEERQRGMTIDIGFAYTDVFGARVGFVDVPGHERFVHNMLVGASGIDLALIVVAADDGVMPQTLEHLQILELLQVPRGIVAITKSDRVDVTSTEVSVVAEVDFAATTQTDCCSSGAGIDALVDAISDAMRTHDATQQADATNELFRLAVDRSFTVAGSGTVVTGMVRAGECERGDELLLLPENLRVRIRGIHANNRDTTHTRRGERAALVLAGVDRAACGRGSWLLHPDSGPLTRHFVAALQVIPHPDHAPEWERLHFHLAASHCLARIRRWRDADGTAFAEVRLETPLPLVRGDRFVLRDPMARNTVGGGFVLDPFPPARGTRRAEYTESLACFRADDPRQGLEAAIQLGLIVHRQNFQHAWNLPAARLERLVSELGLDTLGAGADAVVIVASRVQDYAADIARTIATWHKANPHVRGMRSDQLRAVMKQRMPATLIDAVVARLVELGELQRNAGFVQLPGHRPRLSADDEALWQRVAPLVSEQTRPPVLHDLARRLTMELEPLRIALRRLAFAGLLVQVADNRFFAAPQIDALMQLARTLDAESGTDGFHATQFRDATELGRNLTIDVLQHFDSTGFTLRRGDRRRIARRGITVPRAPRAAVDRRPSEPG